MLIWASEALCPGAPGLGPGALMVLPIALQEGIVIIMMIIIIIEIVIIIIIRVTSIVIVIITAIVILITMIVSNCSNRKELPITTAEQPALRFTT